MKNQRTKTNLLTAIVLAGACFSGISWGHDVTSPQSIGSSSVLNVDVYTVLCNNNVAGGGNGLNPQRIVGQVSKTATATANSMRISLGRVGTAGTGVSQSTASTTAAASSAFAQLASANNVTHVAVIGHSTAIANSYTAKLHCESVAAGALPAPEAPGIETGTTISGGTISGGGQPVINQ